MNGEQLEQAKKKSDELLKYIQKTEQIREFITTISENHKISLATNNGGEMWYNWEEVYELIGNDLIGLLQIKLDEREDYIESIQASDLIAIPKE